MSPFLVAEHIRNRNMCKLPPDNFVTQRLHHDNVIADDESYQSQL